MNDGEKHQEIIIIRRGGEAEHGHHGGAWKIAFADFMTAMMALFLVLWLINAANEETKKAVASYFNPVKLVDRNRSVKGLHDADGVQELEVKQPNQQYPEQQKDSAPSKEKTRTDAQYFSDPFSALDQIASHQVPGEVVAVEEQGGRNGNDAINDAQGGEAFMDPFSPNFWNEEVRPSNDSGQLSGRFETEGAGSGSGVADTGDRKPGDRKSGVDGTGSGDVAGTGAPAATAEKVETAAIGENKAQKPDDAAANAPGDPAVEAAESMRKEIAGKLAEAFGDGSKLAGELTVEASGNEVLISLTDAFDMSMFELGSAIPSHDLVIALEKIGGVLAEQQGGVRIRGYTDARPYRSEDYDNWRLSSARAQSAYYMLLRGGLEETRVQEISGFADRQLLFPDDPFSPRNRRIEVLVGMSDQ